MKIRIIAMAFIATTMIGCGKPVELQISSDSHSEWKAISNTEYSLKHPADLIVNNSGIMGTAFVIFINNKIEPTKFNPNLNLMVQDLQGQNIDLNKYTDISLNQVKRLISNSQIIENARLKGITGEYQKFIYTGTQGVYRLKFEQFYTIANQKAYILTLTCEESQFDNCKGVGEEIMKSLIIK